MVESFYPNMLMIFIIRILYYLTTTCNFVTSLESTCGSNVAILGHNEIHACKNCTPIVICV